MRVAIALTIVLLAGCTTVTWHKDGATQRDLDRATASCRTGSAFLPEPRPQGNGMSDLGASMQSLATRMQFQEDCLTANGWDKVSER